MFSYKSNFPEINKNKYGIILINSFNLPSAIFDAKHLIDLYENTIKLNHIFVYVDNNDNLNKIKNNDSKKKYDNITFCYANNKNNLITNLTALFNTFNVCDLIFSISSHGYANNDKNYIIYNGEHVFDYEFNTLIKNINHSVNCLVLIDACQSGTEMNLNYKTTDLLHISNENISNNTNNIVSISAVSDSQFDMDDISDLGYGGGLTSAFIDYYLEKIDEHLCIGGFYKYYNKRSLGHHTQSILSFNNKSFLLQ